MFRAVRCCRRAPPTQYGITNGGGANDNGTVYKMVNGAVSTLYSFSRPPIQRRLSKIMAQAGLCPSQYLEINPTQAYRCQCFLDVPPQEIVTGYKGAPFGRKYQRLVAHIGAERTPRLDVGRRAAGGMAASRRLRPVFGSPELPRYTRSTIVAITRFIRPHRSAKISPGRSPTRPASRYINQSRISRTGTEDVLCFRHGLHVIPLRFPRRHPRGSPQNRPVGFT